MHSPTESPFRAGVVESLDPTALAAARGLTAMSVASVVTLIVTAICRVLIEWELARADVSLESQAVVVNAASWLLIGLSAVAAVITAIGLHTLAKVPSDARVQMSSRFAARTFVFAAVTLVVDTFVWTKLQSFEINAYRAEYEFATWFNLLDVIAQIIAIVALARALQIASHTYGISWSRALAPRLAILLVARYGAGIMSSVVGHDYLDQSLHSFAWAIAVVAFDSIIGIALIRQQLRLARVLRTHGPPASTEPSEPSTTIILDHGESLRWLDAIRALRLYRIAFIVQALAPLLACALLIATHSTPSVPTVIVVGFIASSTATIIVLLTAARLARLSLTLGGSSWTLVAVVLLTIGAAATLDATFTVTRTLSRTSGVYSSFPNDVFRVGFAGAVLSLFGMIVLSVGLRSMAIFVKNVSARKRIAIAIFFESVLSFLLFSFMVVTVGHHDPPNPTMLIGFFMVVILMVLRVAFVPSAVRSLREAMMLVQQAR